MRRFPAGIALLVSAFVVSCTRSEPPAGVVVNDVHSRLNQTTVDHIVKPDSVDAVQKAIREAGTAGKAVSIAGGRHAMGGQQFGAGTILLDTTGLNRVLRIDAASGIVDVQSGI